MFKYNCLSISYMEDQAISTESIEVRDINIVDFPITHSYDNLSEGIIIPPVQNIDSIAVDVGNEQFTATTYFLCKVCMETLSSLEGEMMGCNVHTVCKGEISSGSIIYLRIE